MQCKCGDRKCWTSMGHASCDVCEKCGSTLAEGPNTHVPQTPHEVYAEITGEKIVARCHRCHQERPLSEATNLEVTRQKMAEINWALSLLGEANQ